MAEKIKIPNWAWTAAHSSERLRLDECWRRIDRLPATPEEFTWHELNAPFQWLELWRDIHRLHSRFNPDFYRLATHFLDWMYSQRELIRPSIKPWDPDNRTDPGWVIDNRVFLIPDGCEAHPLYRWLRELP